VAQVLTLPTAQEIREAVIAYVTRLGVPVGTIGR